MVSSRQGPPTSRHRPLDTISGAVANRLDDFGVLRKRDRVVGPYQRRIHPLVAIDLRTHGLDHRTVTRSRTGFDESFVEGVLVPGIPSHHTIAEGLLPPGPLQAFTNGLTTKQQQVLRCTLDDTLALSVVPSAGRGLLVLLHHERRGGHL